MTGRISWLAGGPTLCARLERLIEGPAGAAPPAWDGRATPLPGSAAADRVWLLREKPGRRRLLRVRLADGDDLFVKQGHARGTGPGLRLARALGIDAARREWRALTRLSHKGVTVPHPRALGLRAGGGTLLVVDFVEGRPLPEWLAGDGRGRNALVSALGDLVASLHAAGWVHRDLHAGNVLVTEAGPVLTDLQAALPLRPRRARLRDLGELDNSLWRLLSLAQRVRLRARALGATRPFASEARRALRQVARASLARGRAQARSRRRRALRPGRRFEAFGVDGWRGLRRRAADAQAITDAVLRHLAGGRAGDAAPGEDARGSDASRNGCAEGSRYAVRSFASAPRAGAARGGLRGSARRAWLAGIGLDAHGIPCERVVAWLAARGRGELLVVEQRRGREPWTRAAARGAAPRALAGALARSALELHGRGVSHGDLVVRNLWVEPRGDALVAGLGGLEAVRFPRRLGEGERLHELARLEASLAGALPDAERERALGLCRLFRSPE